MRDILESGGKLYTQIKIDEITNLGAVTIRLRSLLGALEFAGKPLAAKKPQTNIETNTAAQPEMAVTGGV